MTILEDVWPVMLSSLQNPIRILPEWQALQAGFSLQLRPVGRRRCRRQRQKDRVQRCLAILQRYNRFFFLFCTPIRIQWVLKWDVDGKMGFKLHINGRRTQDEVPNYLQLAWRWILVDLSTVGSIYTQWYCSPYSPYMHVFDNACCCFTIYFLSGNCCLATDITMFNG